MSFLLISSWFTKLSIWVSGVEPRLQLIIKLIWWFFKTRYLLFQSCWHAIMSTWLIIKPLPVCSFWFSLFLLLEGFLNLQFHTWWYANLSVQILEDYCNLYIPFLYFPHQSWVSSMQGCGEHYKDKSYWQH